MYFTKAVPVRSKVITAGNEVKMAQDSAEEPFGVRADEVVLGACVKRLDALYPL